MVNDVCFKNFDLILLCKLFSVSENFHVEDQHTGESIDNIKKKIWLLFLSLVRIFQQNILKGFHHVVLRDRPNTHIRYRNFRFFEEGGQGFQGAESRGSYSDTQIGKLDFVLHLFEVCRELLFSLFHFLFGISDIKLTSSNSIV